MCSRDGGYRVRGEARRARAEGLIAARERSVRLPIRSGVVKTPRSNLYSGSAVVLVNDAAEDVTTSDRTTVGALDRVGNRLGETQAAMWSRFVVVRDVFVEHRLKMSS